MHDTPGTVRLPDGSETVRLPDGSETVRLPDGSEAVRLPDGASTADLLAALGVDARRCVTVVNGVARPRPLPLRDGDRIQLHVNQAGG